MSDHDLYAMAEAHLRTIRDLERDLAAERERVKRLRAAYLDAEHDSVTYALPAHNDEHDDNVTPDEWINVLREAHLDPGDLGDREARS